jgi:two-component system response regulator CpxR
MIYQTTRVLHVDDDPLTTRHSARLLGRYGIDVTPLHDPSQALQRIAEGRFQIVIIDLQMPKISGFELLRRIKAADGATAVIMLTGMSSPATVLCALKQGAAACFFKPLTDVEGLVEVIADINKSNERWRKTLASSTGPSVPSYRRSESGSEADRVAAVVS